MRQDHAGIYLHIEGFEGFDRTLDFNRAKVRAAMRQIGKQVAQQAQLNLTQARGANNYPRVRSGLLRESIGFKVSRSGFLVRVAPKKSAAMQSPYFVYLHYGVKRRVKPHVKRHAKPAQREPSAFNRTWRIKPRANYMANALHEKSEQIRATLFKALQSALEMK